MTERERISRAVQSLSSQFVGDDSVADTLILISELARTAVDGADEVGITLVVDDGPGTYVYTDSVVPEVDQAQYRTGDGPGIAAYDLGDPVVVGDTRTWDEYRPFCASAADQGVLCVMSLPLESSRERLGAMSFYSRDAHAFGSDALAAVADLVDQTAYLLANAQAYWDARTLAENLTEAMSSRAVIEQAKGVIMGSTGCTAPEAFEQLKAQSHHENVKVRDLAEEIVRRARRR